MGTGGSALIWYALCCAFIGFLVMVGGGLFFYGDWKRKKAREARLEEELQREQANLDSAD